jgi:two-component system osmolarity sensor histidine kinase EnvZ
LNADALPEMPVRPRALTRAIGNLIDNAVKYGGSEVSVSLSRQGGEVWIEVGDRGAGIPASETERLKRPFTRLDVARSNATGTGLGLAIVDRIARLHDGRLELLPNPGGGLLARLVIFAATG